MGDASMDKHWVTSAYLRRCQHVPISHFNLHQILRKDARQKYVSTLRPISNMYYSSMQHPPTDSRRGVTMCAVRSLRDTKY